MNPLLDIKNLSLDIGGTPILRDISLSVGHGEICGIAGESGSGKSLTALSVMGLLPMGAQRRGVVRLNGNDLFRRSEAEMCQIRGREIGMIFQEPMTALNPLKTIGSQITETLHTHSKISKAKANEIALEKLARVGLGGGRISENTYPHELSGGQRQRVMIAQAIAWQPALLIADEPTTALDVTTQAGILELLRDLVDNEGLSIMLISHDLAVLADMADHVSIMENGTIVEGGATEPLFRGHRHPYTQKLFAAASHIPIQPLAKFREPLLTVENLRISYRKKSTKLFGKATKFEAVSDVSLQILEGESVGLVGESGCGKSTLARAILGLQPIDTGRIELAGATIASVNNPEAEMRKGKAISSPAGLQQIVFQDPYGSFNPRHKVGRLIAEPFHAIPDAPSGKEMVLRIDAALEEVGLSSTDRDKYIHEFSGGQRQRIAIARALVIKPKLILLDEAVSALDVSIRAQILDLLAELRVTHGLSYLFISHDLSVVRAITDRVLVMLNGQILESGKTSEVLSAPHHDYTKQLIAFTPQIPADWISQ